MPPRTSNSEYDDQLEYDRSTASDTGNSRVRPGFLRQAAAVDASHEHGTFNDVGGDQIIMTSGSVVPEVLVRLKPVDRGAYYVPGCMDGTRKRIFEEIGKWLGNTDEPNILWITGIPGAGKSALASSIASILTERRRLGSSFFFRRGDPVLSDPVALWRTVACDLAQRDSTFANFLVNALNDGRIDPERPDINLHFKILIMEPLTKTYTHSTPFVIVIDALDECDYRALMDTFIQWSRLPKRFKLIITGRDDRVPRSFRAACRQIVLPTGSDVSAEANSDIRRFFEERFAELPGSTDPNWPGEEILDLLTAKAAGLFLWAETVARLLAQGPPMEQLRYLLEGGLTAGNNLDESYRQILDSSFQHVDSRALATYESVVSAIVLAKVPFPYDDLPHFLSQEKSTVDFILDKLSSVILVGVKDKRLKICHPSFSEFLCDPGRCPQAFFIDRDMMSQGLAMACFARMTEGLKFNICDLETSYIRNDDVEDLSERVEKNIPGPLLYSCCYWTAHLRDTMDVLFGSSYLLQEVSDFLKHRFLYWLEVMSLVKQVSVANAVLLTVIPWINEFDTHISALVRDASRFIVNFDIPISESVPHIYLSALPFTPPESFIAQQYQPQFSNTLSIASGRDVNWSALLSLFRGHASTVNSVSFSPDGQRVVSGSSDCTIRIWDANTSQITAGPWEGHEGVVTSVVFAPDGKRIASGSSDRTIRIWDTGTGKVTVGPFQGHTDAVTSVAFSPDGESVVSGSLDKTIRIWDVETGQLITDPLEGHVDAVTSTNFSPDGLRIVSGSRDDTVRIWDVRTGQASVGPLEGHTDSVTSVAFSPDGKRIVSGSSDRTIRIWDAKTGQITVGPLKAHTDAITSVIFSLDGRRVVSGSKDRTIRIWDAETGQVTAGPFAGHIDAIASVKFSPDGKRVVSGSLDHTIRIWDAETGLINTGPSGHIDAVTSVAFSSDGKRAVSGSSDRTIRIWDVETGRVTAGPFRGHTDAVTSVIFSPDGRQVASGSKDSTIRIWDVETGRVTAGPFGGHTNVVISIAFSPDATLVVSSSSDKTIRIWDAETGRITSGPLEGHSDPAIYVTFSPDGRWIVSGSLDNTILIWDVNTGLIAAGPFESHINSVSSVAFSADAERVAWGSSDKTINVWDMEAQKVTAGPFEGHTDVVTSISFSPDGSQIASGSTDKTIRIWDVDTGQVIAGPLEGHTAAVNSVAFSSDAKLLVSGSSDNIVRFWDISICQDSSSQTRGRILRGARTHSGWLLLPSLDSKDEPRDQLQFWVPPFLLDGLCGIETRYVLGTRTTRLDLTSFAHGSSWMQCHSTRVEPAPEITPEIPPSDVPVPHIPSSDKPTHDQTPLQLAQFTELDMQSETFASALRDRLDSKEYSDLISSLAEDQLSVFIDFLDRALNVLSVNTTLYFKTLRALSQICGQTGQLPSSYLIVDGLERFDELTSLTKSPPTARRGIYRENQVVIKPSGVYARSDSVIINKKLSEKIVMWKRLSHSNILPLLGISDMGSHDLCMVSKWVKHGNVLEYLDSHTETNRYKLLLDAAKGVQYLHSLDVVHGNLKASNILVDDSEHAQIADFGVIDIVNDTFTEAASQYPSLSARGSVQWTAPELLKNGQPYSVRPTLESDIYALAMVVIEVFTGKIPFPDWNEERILYKILHGMRPSRPEQVGHVGLSDDVWKMVQACWHKDAIQRPKISDVLDCFSRAVDATFVPPSLVRPPSFAPAPVHNVSHRKTTSRRRESRGSIFRCCR